MLLFLCQCDDGECGQVQGAGILSSPQTAEHQESGQMVPHLERQAQVIHDGLGGRGEGRGAIECCHFLCSHSRKIFSRFVSETFNNV